ncbi:MAG TPA: hypothetical protein VF228_17375 [Iamia sp.]
MTTTTDEVYEYNATDGATFVMYAHPECFEQYADDAHTPRPWRQTDQVDHPCDVCGEG